MKIFSASQVKAWDQFSIQEQQISSDALMERAAGACFHWLGHHGFATGRPLKICCGKGNNGGDGLALARILLQHNFNVTTYVLETGKPGSDDFQLNLQRLHQLTADIHFIQSEVYFPAIKHEDILIDALFGSGLNKPLEGTAAQLVNYINQSPGTVISIDIPSGLFVDRTSAGNSIIRASHTLSFQSIKPAFLFAENAPYVGSLHILPIGLSKTFEESTNTPYEMIEEELVRSLVRPRNEFAHKGNFGHAALVAGSHGMMGAALLAAKACTHSGAGKLTVYIPSCGYSILQSQVPEAMCKVAGSFFLADFEHDLAQHQVIGLGPGIGTAKETIDVVRQLLLITGKSFVLDADALNIIASERLSIPPGSLLTPHPGEFDRLFGKADNDFHRLAIAVEQAASLGIYIILKGHFSAIITPYGKVYFNSTGNAGMAKAGMGDVLTGFITGLMAQGYPLPEAAIMGVFLHGLAGDIAASKSSRQAMQASDLINNLATAWLQFEQ